MKATYCYVHPRDLQSGDEVSEPQPSGSRTYVIERVTGGTASRSGIIRWQDTVGKTVRCWHMTAHLRHLVTGGPKMAAARLHPELIDEQHNWTGGIAPEEAKTK